jgi:protein-S-isoprenylcysteine O-methyltransferase Ste14
MIPKPPAVAGACLIAALLADFYITIRIIPHPFDIAGIPVFLAGGLLMAWTVRTFKAHSTTYKVGKKPSRLVTEGPMRHSRNPIYLGFTLMLLGIGLLVGSPWMLAAPAAFFLVMNFVQVPEEEKALSRQFGTKYTNFRKRTRRWV